MSKYTKTYFISIISIQRPLVLYIVSFFRSNIHFGRHTKREENFANCTFQFKYRFSNERNKIKRKWRHCRYFSCTKCSFCEFHDALNNETSNQHWHYNYDDSILESVKNSEWKLNSFVLLLLSAWLLMRFINWNIRSQEFNKTDKKSIPCRNCLFLELPISFPRSSILNENFFGNWMEHQ